MHHSGGGKSLRPPVSALRKEVYAPKTHVQMSGSFKMVGVVAVRAHSGSVGNGGDSPSAL